MRRKDEAGARGAGRFLARPFILAVIVVLLVAGYIVLFGDGADEPEGLGNRPTGAGTLPEGVADEQVEGIEGGTSAGDIIDNSAASDTRPAILDVEDAPEGASDVDELEAPAPVDEGAADPGSPGEPSQ